MCEENATSLLYWGSITPKSELLASAEITVIFDWSSYVRIGVPVINLLTFPNAFLRVPPHPEYVLYRSNQSWALKKLMDLR